MNYNGLGNSKIDNKYQTGNIPDKLLWCLRWIFKIISLYTEICIQLAYKTEV